MFFCGQDGWKQAPNSSNVITRENVLKRIKEERLLMQTCVAGPWVSRQSGAILLAVAFRRVS